MKTYLAMGLALTAGSMGACGGTNNILGDGGTQDMAMAKLFKLQSGDYQVSTLTINNDGCMVNPNDISNPTIGKVFTLTNDGSGNIGLGTLGGMPPQPSNGASCPGTPLNAACATAPNAKPFNNNMGTLVRDNNIDDMMGCTEHRHVENLLTLTADNTFTSAYIRTDTMHKGCMAMADCTTTWTWSFVKK